MKKSVIIIAVVLVINAIIIGASVKSGRDKGDMMLRFHEREAVTFLSALMLGLTSLSSLILFKLKTKVDSKDKGRRFWLFSSLGFFYLCMDEYFMAHEGMDEMVGSLFGKNIKYLNLDNFVIVFFGLAALAVCFCFRKELFKHKELKPFLLFGAVGLVGTVVFHAFERINIVLEVIEESFKIVGVSFFFAGFFTTLLAYINNISCKQLGMTSNT
ncbi:MAG: hypothetical protein JW867_04515 [Candidatus Omnitrophica bacterium]|nr:hypothetical protein [Candidatus Omnitrophota bacterium]